MDFDFTKDQVMLRDLAREFLTEQCTVDHVRAMMTDPVGYDDAMYRQLAEMSLLGLAIPERYGGSGMGMIEQAIVLEEMGRVAYPGPFVPSVVLAATAVTASGDEEAMARYLPGLATGELKMSYALIEDDIGWGPAAVAMRAVPDGDNYRLSGTKRFVPWGNVADVFVVAVRTGDGPDDVSLLAVPRDTAGLTIEPEVMFDLNSKTSALVFDHVAVPAENLIGSLNGAAPALEAVLERAAVASCAEMLGASRKSLEMAVSYAKVRKQFGQVIGTFQAIKHKLAEMLEAAENAHSATYYAAWALDADAPDRRLAVSVAKSTVNEAARRVCGDAIQVHGGIGFTWEYDLHLYFKRAKHLEPMWGDTDFHRERVLEEVLAGRVAGTTANV
ncbi:MAG TPA: acyl-CoA dehydrogenase family protein [Thermomicrobiaceae bacterium]|nr:acyl-CoA dehydrogenase family protein [Thermomicrobiaceae bacterium]